MAQKQVREQVVQRETVPVFLSDRRVLAFEAASVIPEGYRQATSEEVTLRYRYDADFRRELYNKGAAWTSDKGLKSSGYHQISEDGKHTQVDRAAFSSLRPEERSYHHSGSGSVAVNCWDDGLGVVADVVPSDEARVAYVKDDTVVAPPKSAVDGIVVPPDKFDAAKEAFRKEEPTMHPDSADAFRAVFGE